MNGSILTKSGLLGIGSCECYIQYLTIRYCMYLYAMHRGYFGSMHFVMHTHSHTHRDADKLVRVGGGAGMLLSVYSQIFGYSPLKLQCTTILLEGMNLKNWGASAP